MASIRSRTGACLAPAVPPRRRASPARALVVVMAGIVVAGTSVGLALAQGGGPPAPPPPAPPARPWKSRALPDLVDRGLRSRPRLSAEDQRVRAAEEVPSRVSSLPDPSLQVAASNFRFDDPRLTGSPMTGLTLGVVQVVPFPGKLRRRGEAAWGQAHVAARQLDLAQTEVTLDVRRAYWQLWTAERVETLLTDTYDVLNDLANVIHARFSVGQTAQQDALQVEAVQSEVRARVIEQRQVRISGARAVERAAGLAPAGTTRTSAKPPAPRDLSRDALVNQALDANPTLRLSRQRAKTSRLTLEAVRRDQLPDFFFGAGYRLRRPAQGDPTDGADMFSLSMGITLPIFLRRKQAAAVREWGHRVAADVADTEDLELEVRTQLEKALDALDRLAAQIDLYQSELLPETNASLDASISDYQFDRVTLASVLQNWRSDLSARIQLANLQGAYAEQLAVIHALLGDTGGKENP